jgi:predicted transcriptional regulator
MIGTGLSRREREILDILHREGRASVAQIQAALPDAPSYSAVRSLLAVLLDKGHVRHERQGKRYLYRPVEPRQQAATAALQQVLGTFFGGSLANAARTFLDEAESDVSDEELARLAELVEETRRREEREEEGKQ